MSTISAPETTYSVTELDATEHAFDGPVTLDTVITAMLDDATALEAAKTALSASAAAFVSLALTTYRGQCAGIQDKVVAAAAKAQGLQYSNANQIAALARTGHVFTLGGVEDLPEGISPRDVYGTYVATKRVAGTTQGIAVKPTQHTAVISKALDVPEAYRLLRKANLDNLAAVKNKVAASAATAESAETTDEPTESAPTSRVELLTAALVALTAASDVSGPFSADERETLDAIADAIDALTDQATEQVAA